MTSSKKDFRSPNYVEIAESKFYLMRQEPDENVTIYGQRMRDLVADASAENNPITIEEITCETFVRGQTTNLRTGNEKRQSSQTLKDPQRIEENESHLLEIVQRERGICYLCKCWQAPAIENG